MSKSTEVEPENVRLTPRWLRVLGAAAVALVMGTVAVLAWVSTTAASAATRELAPKVESIERLSSDTARRLDRHEASDAQGELEHRRAVQALQESLERVQQQEREEHRALYRALRSGQRQKVLEEEPAP